MSNSVSFAIGKEQNLNDATKIAGQIKVTEDTHNMYLDINNDKRVLIGVGKNTINSGEIFNDYENNIAVGGYAHAEGGNTYAEGYGAHAEGGNTYAEGRGAHAEGNYTYANKGSHAEGNGTRALSDDEVTSSEAYPSHAEGTNSYAIGRGSHASGYGTSAYGLGAYTEGYVTNAFGFQSHAEGYQTTAGAILETLSNNTTRIKKINYALDADGHETNKVDTSEQGNSAKYGEIAINDNISYNGYIKPTDVVKSDFIGTCSHAEGSKTWAYGNQAHAEGYGTIASGAGSHAEGNITHATNTASHAEGDNTNAISRASHAEGYGTIAGSSDSNSGTQWGAHAEGLSTIASNKGSHSEGQSTQATGEYSHAEGNATKAEGRSSHAEGFSTTASGSQAHAEGNATIASGVDSHAEGKSTQATGTYAHAEGFQTLASGGMSHAEGRDSVASGYASHAGGYGTKATVLGQTVIGKWNAEVSNTLFIVGNGASDTSRSNAFVVDTGGNATIANTLTAKKNNFSTPKQIMLLQDETTKRYSYNETRYGIDMNNSDIKRINGLWFADVAAAQGEGIMFKNNEKGWTQLWGVDGKLYLAQNSKDYNNYGTGTFNLSDLTKYEIYHTGNLDIRDYITQQAVANNYYNKSTIDTKFSNYYTASQVDSKINNKVQVVNSLNEVKNPAKDTIYFVLDE